MPADRRVDGARARVGVALDDGVIDLLDGSIAERVLEHGVGPLAERDHHHPGGADIKPVHNPAALLRARGAGPDAQPGQRAEHSWPGPPWAWVRCYPNGLVDNGDVG